MVATGHREGFGRVLIEAMLSKIPVVATESGAHKEIIKNNYNGWLFKTNDINELVNRVIKILELKKKQLNKVLNRAEKTAKKKFNSKKHALEVQKIYIKINSN